MAGNFLVLPCDERNAAAGRSRSRNLRFFTFRETQIERHFGSEKLAQWRDRLFRSEAF